MDKSSNSLSSAAKSKTKQITKGLLVILSILLTISIPVCASIAALHFQELDPAPLPDNHSFSQSILVPVHVDQVLALTEKIGDGHLPAPEDLSYDFENGFLYTGCDDGWIRRLKLIGDERFKVEDVAHVGGRPVGVAVTPDGGVAIAHAQKVEKIDLVYFIIGMLINLNDFLTVEFSLNINS